jgi:hypothetical protein
MDPRRLTETRGLPPNLSTMAGTVRATPTGTILPGPHKVSAWSHWFDVDGNRLFSSDVKKMIDHLEPHKALLGEITKSAGSIDLIVELPGDVNIGDSLSWREMGRLADLHIDLGTEVFPEMR